MGVDKGKYLLNFTFYNCVFLYKLYFKKEKNL